MPKEHVIVGGGPAGLYAIETIREYDKESAITLVCDEPVYSRMSLPYYIAGNIPEDHLMTGSPDFFRALNVRPTLGKRATAVDTKGNRVTLDDGSSLPYDSLLIATGSAAQRLPIPGADQPNVINLWTLDDAKRALTKAKPGANVVFIGAGFIGFIILNAMAKVGCKLSVVEIEEQILPRMLDAPGATLVRKWLTDKGVGVFTGTRVTEIGQLTDGRKNVRLSDGRALTADLVVLATGIQPNIDLVKGSDIKTAQGILVNNQLQTSVANVYAAGDVAQGPDLLTGRQEIHAVQPTAQDHGRIAGANMAGQNLRYEGSLLMNILDVIGLHCTSFGLWRDDGRETKTISNASRPVYRKLLFDGDRLVGAILLGPADDVSMLNDMGMVKGFIQTKTALGSWKQYLLKQPLDIRRPYIACKVAEKLLQSTLLKIPTPNRQYRFRNLQPTIKPNPAHQVLVGTRPAVERL
jgi:NAD(P)H-nitrite reductase large subunit